MPEIPRLPTKLAREESRSLPRPLLEPLTLFPDVSGDDGVCEEGVMVGIRRSPKPSNTDASKELPVDEGAGAAAGEGAEAG